MIKSQGITENAEIVAKENFPSESNIGKSSQNKQRKKGEKAPGRKPFIGSGRRLDRFVVGRRCNHVRNVAKGSAAPKEKCLFLGGQLEMRPSEIRGHDSGKLP